MFLLGLTGSIGMGKSTTARMFADLGCAVWDADAAVHRLYGPAGAAVNPIAEIFPQAILDNAVSRDTLKKIISKNPDALKKIEHVVHPLVALDRADFIKNAKADILVFDIPLLFETGGDQAMDATVCVYVSDEVQHQRVMDRGTMSEDQFLAIREKQIPASEKCARADYVIDTLTLEGAQRQVQDVVNEIRGKLNA